MVLISCRDFNITVNMTAEELEKWLKGSASKDTGWSKSDGSGESIGHERQVTLPHSHFPLPLSQTLDTVFLDGWSLTRT